MRIELETTDGFGSAVNFQILNRHPGTREAGLWLQIRGNQSTVILKLTVEMIAYIAILQGLNTAPK